MTKKEAINLLKIDTIKYKNYVNDNHYIEYLCFLSNG
jgi:hypothetical protein